MDYIDFNGPDGQSDNMGGTTQRLWYARKSDFLVIQEPSASLTLGDIVTISTAHTFKPGKCFKEMYSTRDKGEVMAEPQGDTDGKSLKIGAKSFLPGSDPLAHGFAKLAKNDQFIVIEEMADGQLMQIGTKRFPATCTPKFNSGKNSSGVKGYDFDWETNETSMLVYTGAVTVVPAP